MAVSSAPPRPMMESAENQKSKMAAWSGVISWAVYALVGLLLAALVVTVVVKKLHEDREDRSRQAWDQVYLALKDAESPEDQIKALEGVWDEVSGKAPHPYVMMRLAQLHFQQSLSPRKSPRARQEARKRAHLVYKLVLKDFPKNPLYGPPAAQGVAQCLEQEGDYTGAIEVLREAVERYEKHFLFPQLCYQLGRDYWLREQKKPDGKKDREAARKAALRWIKQSLAGDKPGPYDFFSWRREARFLRSLLEKPGVGLPDGKAPPPKPKAKAKAKTKQKTPKDGKKSGGEKKEPGVKRSVPLKKKSERGAKPQSKSGSVRKPAAAKPAGASKTAGGSQPAKAVHKTAAPASPAAKTKQP